MKTLGLSFLFLMLLVCSKNLSAQEVKDLKNIYMIVSTVYSLPDNNQQHFADVDFVYGLNKKVPFKIAIQFTNHGYATRKFKFAIQDTTSKKMVVLDPIHNSRFGSETLMPVTEGLIWSGPIDSNKDRFSLHVWDSDGDEFDAAPVSVSEQP